MKKRILYVYENRIPIEIRKLIIGNIKKHGFHCSSMNYQAPKKIQKKNFFSADAVFFAPGRHIDTEVLKMAKKAWRHDQNVNFKKGNIYKLPFKKKMFDITFCSNVLLHLPEIKKPLEELLKVTRKKLILRTVVYDVSYKIQLVYNNKWWKYTNVRPIDEFDEKGNPRSFSYFNIHSKDYLISLIKKIAPRAKIKFIKDNKFSAKNILKSRKNEKRPLATNVVNGEQYSGCLMQPHYFIIVSL